jgi:Flp pilus assembly pilin Flp
MFKHELPLRLDALLRRKAGQAMAEYAVILALVGAVVVVVVIVLGNQVKNIFCNISGALPRGVGPG